MVNRNMGGNDSCQLKHGAKKACGYDLCLSPIYQLNGKALEGGRATRWKESGFLSHHVEMPTIHMPKTVK